VDIIFLSELNTFCKQFGLIISEARFHVSAIEIELKYILSFFFTESDFKARDLFKGVNAIFHILSNIGPLGESFILYSRLHCLHLLRRTLPKPKRTGQLYRKSLFIEG
jgi:hypothetical protein